MSDSPGWDRPDTGDGPPGPDGPAPQHPTGPTTPGGGAWTQGGWQGGPAGTPSAPTPGPGWQLGAPQPGVIPLRPLGVGEILDGSVTTIRKNPAATLGTSAIVAVLTQLLGILVAFLTLGSLTDSDLLDLQRELESGNPDPDAVLSLIGNVLTVSLITVGVVYLASVFLTGALTLVVGRAVLGERMSMGEALRGALPRVPALIGLTLLVGLVVAAPVVIGLLVVLLVGSGTGDATATVGFAALVILLTLPLALWLGIRFSIATPALMLETTGGSGASAPVRMTVVGAMRRSAALVRTSWWRVFGVILLVGLIGTIINAVFTVPFDQIGFGVVGDGYLGLLISTVGAILASTLSVPFVAAGTVLLYIDRRIRAEGLDIELANAAGVQIPGRTSGPGGPAGGHGWTQDPR